LKRATGSGARQVIGVTFALNVPLVLMRVCTAYQVDIAAPAKYLLCAQDGLYPSKPVWGDLSGDQLLKPIPVLMIRRCRVIGAVRPKRA
jgi:hypothetical protein